MQDACSTIINYGRYLMTSSVLFERTLAIRQGIDSLADYRMGGRIV
jgi:hypothetical protein